MGELLASITAAEFRLWQDYYQRYGFDADRAEWAAANAGAAVARPLGARVSPRDLVPRFRSQAQPAEVVKSWFDSLTPERFGNGR